MSQERKRLIEEELEKIRKQIYGNDELSLEQVLTLGEEQDKLEIECHKLEVAEAFRRNTS